MDVLFIKEYNEEKSLILYFLLESDVKIGMSNLNNIVVEKILFPKPHFNSKEKQRIGFQKKG